jgi:radical SAM superfamily enzyme YgiQ (UPF0313 family)
MKTSHDRQRLLADEKGTIRKSHRGRLRVALIYPNAYHVAMSCLGFQTAYRLFNEPDDVVCERAFLPDEQEGTGLTPAGAGLRTLESNTDLRAFDLVAFSLTFEKDWLHVLRLLRLAGIPAWPAERDDEQPLLLFGGVGMMVNPEPVAPFADLIAVGDGEVTIPRIVEALRQESKKGDVLGRLLWAPGMYVPSRYRSRSEGGRLVEFGPTTLAPARVRPAQAGKDAPYPHRYTTVVTPHTEFGDRLLVEVSNGCRWGCRFCWIGFNQLPPRNAPPGELLELIRARREDTRRVGLVAASVCDYPGLYDVLDGLGGDFDTSLSALRIDAVDDRFADVMARTGQKTPTMAPEAGSDRLRAVVNKPFGNADIVATADKLFERGFPNLKLYFIIGLPTETDRDVAAIVDLTGAVRQVMLRHGRRRGRLGTLSVRVSCFVPKPNIPFQWLGMEAPAVLGRRIDLLRKGLGRLANVRLNVYSTRETELQTALSMGDRDVGRLVEATARTGSFQRARKELGFDLEPYVYRRRDFDEWLPWDVIDTGMPKEWLRREYQRAVAARITTPCPEVEGCHRCGVC